MARYDGQPTPGYEPELKLSLRKDKEGGSLRDPLEPKWKALALRQNELLVLVHGFNNHQGEAEQAYLAFRERQRAKIESESRQEAFEELLGDMFWPGDANWPGVIDRLDFLVYPHAVTVAQHAGPLLKDYLLKRRDDVLVVHFLAHSLGCRLVLETIRALSSEGGPKIGKVCLMAAAVPTFKVCPGGELFDALSEPQFLRVLFSPADIVLHWTFPPGQTLASGDEGFFPAAVGRHGDIPLHPGVVDREEIAEANHGDYWGKNSGTPSDVSAAAITNFFQFDGLTAARNLPERPAPPYQSLPTRRVGTPRNIADPSQ